MVGAANQSVFDAVQPYFSCLGKATYTGLPGYGQHTKASNQILIATTMCGVVEALMYAHSVGLDLAKVSPRFTQLSQRKTFLSFKHYCVCSC